MLEETADGATHLIVLARGGPGYHFQGLTRWIAARIVPIVHFVMQRKHLGIAWRAGQAHTVEVACARQPAH